MTVARKVRDFAAKQSLDSCLASENIRRETSAAEAEEARNGMEEMSERGLPGERARSSICRRIECTLATRYQFSRR